MESGRTGGRALKRVVLGYLQASNFDHSLAELKAGPGKRVINPLFAFLLHSDRKVRWRAVTAMGVVVDALAKDNMESARVIMRRLMWSLNDESGGIGWGAPEAMGEILARNEALGREFGRVFISYFDPLGNYIEYEILQRGLLWGLVRLAHAKPDLVRDVGGNLRPYLKSDDSIVRGLAVWAAGLLKIDECVPDVIDLLEDDTEIIVFWDDSFSTRSISGLAGHSLEILRPKMPRA